MATQVASPGTESSVQDTAGDVAWGTTGNAGSSDDTYSTAASVSSNAYTEYLSCTNFGFTIPAGATINGVSVDVEGKASAGSTTFIDSQDGGNGGSGYPQLIVGGSLAGTGKPLSATTYWSTTEKTETYGGAADVWGTGGLTVAQVNGSTFGVAVRWKRTGSTARDAQVDHVEMTITYTAASGTTGVMRQGVGDITKGESGVMAARLDGVIVG